MRESAAGGAEPIGGLGRAQAAVDEREQIDLIGP
jgi:hypothetical protein